jgi:hypothetical protein
MKWDTTNQSEEMVWRERLKRKISFPVIIWIVADKTVHNSG